MFQSKQDMEGMKNSFGEEFIQFLSKKWTIEILLAFYNCSNKTFTVLRYTDLEDILHDKSTRTLNVRLNDFEKRKFIIKKRDSTNNRLTHYYLTTKGEKLVKELISINRWVVKTFDGF